MNFMKTGVAAMLLLLAACGQDASTSNAGNDAAHEHSHGHSHTNAHVLGQFKLDDGYFMQASHTGAIKGGGDVAFEITFKHNDKPDGSAEIRIFAGSASGKSIGEEVTAAWDDEAKLYKASLKLPAALPHGTHIHFEAKAGDKLFSKSVDVMGHDHS